MGTPYEYGYRYFFTNIPKRSLVSCGIMSLLDQMLNCSASCAGQGVVAIREKTSFTDGLLDLVTLGIYSPRSSWYHCRARK